MTKKEQLQKLLKQKKGKGYYASRIGVSEREIDRLLQEIKNSREKELSFSDEWELWASTHVNVEKGTLESSKLTDYEPKGADELAKLHKVDLNKYKISSYWTKKKGDKFESSLLCTLKKPIDYSLEDFSKFLKGWKPPKMEALKRVRVEKVDKQEVDVEISLADFHLDRLTLYKDDVEDRRSEYLRTLINLVCEVDYSYKIRELVFVIGNDLFNTDNALNSTTNLTPQDVSVPWNEAYEEGFTLMSQAIRFLKDNCEKLKVILVQGNHDRTKSYYLAHALSILFPDVEFDREHSNTKFTILGNTFIGYHHGDKVKLEELPLVFSSSPDSCATYGLSKYREIHTADKHFYMVKEVKGVRIQQIPSMVNPDRWSDSNNYINNIRAGLALVYHPTKGKICEFESRI